MDFQVGEKVVYPNHGVGVIEQINSWPVGPAPQRCYLLRIHASSLRVTVPFANARTVGLRRIVKTQEVNRILRFLADGKCSLHQDWKVRFKENSEKMRSGSLLHVAEVLKCLLLVSRNKELSFRERKMLDRARHLLINEMAVAMKTSETAVETALAKALAKARLQLTPELPA